MDDEDPIPVLLLGDLAYPLMPYLMKECAMVKAIDKSSTLD